jgi:hypothetical protein
MKHAQLKKRLKSTIARILTNRQRIEFATRDSNTDLQYRLLRVQVESYDTLVSDLIQYLDGASTPAKQDKVLVFSERYPDGHILSRDAYQLLCRSMDRDDFNTHVVCDVDADVTDAVSDQALFLSGRARKSKIKTG